MAHCQTTSPAAHFLPSSLLTDAIAAMQGLYKRLKISRLKAERLEREFVIPPANKISIVETTLSFAIIPEIREVQILQSFKPIGFIRGAKRPEIFARILSEEFSTKERCKSKLCKNQISIVAIKITVKALSKKSFAFSHKSWATFFGLGRR